MSTCMTIVHETRYRYARPVTVNPHRLLLRPRESAALRLRAMDLRIEPAATVVWSEDVFGNAVATARFTGRHAGLDFTCTSEVEVLTPPWPVFDIAASASRFPFAYAASDRADLGILLQADDDPGLASWARSFVASDPTDTLSLLKDINAFPSSAFRYEARDDEGTQSPIQTLERQAGTCRDYAELFTQAVRSLGFAARVVTGYLYDADGPSVRGAGASHAWSQVYVPGAGWIAFDPTNGTVGGAQLVPVAVGSQMRHLVPVAGSFDGDRDAFIGMSVKVEVTDATPA